MSAFLDKAKEMAENVKDNIEDHIPDSIKGKLHLGNDADDAVEDTAGEVAGDAAPTEEQNLGGSIAFAAPPVPSLGPAFRGCVAPAVGGCNELRSAE